MGKETKTKNPFAGFTLADQIPAKPKPQYKTTTKTIKYLKYPDGTRVKINPKWKV